jgi:glycosyltransferase involved in cell wall biosynthesis
MNTEKKVAVLLSSYNGEKYIAEQIDSILNQTYPNIDIYVRDDCSRDGTVEILRDYAKDDSIILIEGEKNLGYPEGFYEMLRTVTEADYFSFSDQDDIWEPDKISRAVVGLNRRAQDKPALFFANYDICDEKLNYIRTSSCLRTKPEFRNSLYACLGLGFTFVLNRAAKEMITNQRSVYGETKDVWIGMLCSAFGEIIFDRKPCAKHRKNPGAYSAQESSFWQTQKERFKQLFLDDGFTYVHTVMQEFYDTYKDEMRVQDRKELELFVTVDHNPVHVLKKVFYPHRLRYDMKDEIMLRAVFFLGRL